MTHILQLLDDAVKREESIQQAANDQRLKGFRELFTSYFGELPKEAVYEIIDNQAVVHLEDGNFCWVIRVYSGFVLIQPPEGSTNFLVTFQRTGVKGPPSSELVLANKGEKEENRHRLFLTMHKLAFD